MLISTECEGVSILDVCCVIDDLAVCDVNYDEERRIVTLDGVDVFSGKTLECYKFILGMYVMAVYLKGGFEELQNLFKEIKE